jgi:coenzyme F420-reducing hydrogenase beta subunit
LLWNLLLDFMIEIKTKSLCCGCKACLDACKHSAIVMVEDAEGFIYPHVDKSKCVDCGLCNRVCPYIPGNAQHVRYAPFEHPIYYAGQLRKEQELFEVSSGGACWALVQAVIQKGGVVYGAKQIGIDNICHVCAHTLTEAKELRRSKYLPSDTGGVFSAVKQSLKDGCLVLFCGTGCQVAALNTFLGKPNDNLFTIDVVCHGVPSVKVWQKYREEKERKEGKRMVDLNFRDKSKGWLHNQYRITYDDGSVEYEDSTQQLFHAGYLRGLFYRPSCGCCKFASVPRVSDISLADFWKYRGRFHSERKNVGVSLIAVNTEKGRKLLSYTGGILDIEETPERLALESCRHMDEHPIENPQRKDFFSLFLRKGYHVAAARFLTPPQPFMRRVKQKIKRILNMK